MARCPLCGKPLDWAELIDQMLEKGVKKDVFREEDKFIETFSDFVFVCPHCGEEFYGRSLPISEAKKVFELLKEFKGSIDWERRKVRLRLNSLLALDSMLENWDRKIKGQGF